MSSPGLSIVYQDDCLLAVDKPSGLLVHRGWGRDRVTALSLARDLVGRWVYPVHRLDRGTSGLLLFALDPQTHRELGQRFEGGGLQKRYVALVRGQPPFEGIIDHPVPRGEQGARVSALTHFRMLQRSPIERCSLVEARPATGRTHQIRRHFKHLSHPLIGDSRYGKGPLNRHFAETYGFRRLALHAFELGFAHPRTGTLLSLRAPLPPELLALLAALQLSPVD